MERSPWLHTYGKLALVSWCRLQEPPALMQIAMKTSHQKCLEQRATHFFKLVTQVTWWDMIFQAASQRGNQQLEENEPKPSWGVFPKSPEGLIVDVAQVRWVDQILIKSLLVAIPQSCCTPLRKRFVSQKENKCSCEIIKYDQVQIHSKYVNHESSEIWRVLKCYTHWWHTLINTHPRAHACSRKTHFWNAWPLARPGRWDPLKYFGYLQGEFKHKIDCTLLRLIRPPERVRTVTRTGTWGCRIAQVKEVSSWTNPAWWWFGFGSPAHIHPNYWHSCSKKVLSCL